LKTTIDKDTIIVRKKEIPSTDIGGEVGLMNIDTGKYFALNTIGSDIWYKLDKPISLQSLVNSLIEEYDIDYDTCFNEVKPFIEKLLHEGIITVQ